MFLDPARRRWILTSFASVDPRSLGLARIFLGTLCLVDLLRRLPYLATWYSNEGLLPNHTLLWRPAARWQFSLFFTASTEAEARAGFLLAGIAFTCLLIGYRTRVAHAFSLVFLVSLHSRNIVLENGGDVVLNLFATWTLFLPLGSRFSIDAVLASLKARKERSPADLAVREPEKSAKVPAVSLAIVAMTLQLCVIYAFNAVHKNGPTWKAGHVVHYVLHQDRIVTGLGLWVRDHLPLWIGQAMTWGSLVIEALLPVLLLLPVGRIWARRMAILLAVLLHAGFAAFLNLGLFSATMVGFFTVFVPARDWELLKAWWARRRSRCIAFFDADCGICLLTARILIRLDKFDCIEFVSNDDRARLPPGVTPELVQSTIVVLDLRSGEVMTRGRAMMRLVACLPFGQALTWPARLPGMRGMIDWVYDRVAQNRTRISTSLGLAACGLVRTETIEVRPEPVASCRLRAFLREATVFVLMLATASQVLVENRAIPSWLRPKQPGWMAAIVTYPRLFQGWQMFAPDGPLGDQMIYVDALTADGRHIDPYNLVASGKSSLPVTSIPPRLDQNQFFCDYTLRIPGHRSYHQAFIDWILKHHERTGRAEDRIVSFAAFEVTDQSPAPGGAEPHDVKITRFLSHP